MQRLQNLLLLVISLCMGLSFSIEGVTKKASYEKLSQPASKLNSAKIVNALIEKKRKESQTSEHFLEENYFKRLRGLYSSYEMKLSELRQSMPIYPVAGGLNYTITLDEMVCTIQKKFREMRKKGLIVTREEFKKYDKQEWFFKPGSNLTRIWGSEYLAERFKQEKKSSYKVPSYIIVVDDLTNLKILVCWAACFPIISRINGDIYAQRILGRPARPDVGFGFSDYTGPNILKNDDGLYYVIDTEYRSFYKAAPEKELYKNLKEDWPSLCEYLKNRFLLINKLQGTSKSFKFSVA